MKLLEIYETPKGYTNITFAPQVQGDKVNDALLKDINKAAMLAGITVGITTAITGHDKYTHSKNISRHVKGDAVDINFINGINYYSEPSARQLGVYDLVMKFVEQLQRLGYTKNQESGNDKAVLTFGFAGHDDHIHVSNRTGSSYSDDGGDLLASNTGTTTTKKTDGTKSQIEKDAEDIYNQIVKSRISKITPDSKFVNAILPSFSESLNRELDRFKTLIK